jgi:hypothetical protein
MNIQNASLILKSCDAIYDTSKVNITWNNINLRTLLGDMYDQFDMFNLCLNTVSHSNSALTNANTNIDQRNVILNVSGLPWINQTYNTSYLSNTSSVVLGTFLFGTTGTVSSQYFYSSNISTFGKNQELVNLTLSYSKITDNLQPATGGGEVFPHIVLIFDIFGIDTTKHNITKHRMIQ